MQSLVSFRGGAIAVHYMSRHQGTRIFKLVFIGSSRALSYQTSGFSVMA